MAAVSGNPGNVTFTSGYVANVKSWKGDHECPNIDVSDFVAGAAGARTRISSGWESFSGSYTCNFDSSTLVVKPGGAATAMVLTACTGQTFSFNAIATKYSISDVKPGELVEVTYDFESTGAISIA